MFWVHKLLTTKLKHDNPQRASYWQSVLRIGLPFICVYHIIHYILFVRTSLVLRFPSLSEIIGDIVMVLVVSTLDWRSKCRRTN